MTLSYLAAAGAAVAYGVATVLQAVGARRTAKGAVDLHLLVRLIQQLPYLAGLALDLVGFALTVVALRSLPLFLVQSMVASNVAVTALTAMLLLRARLKPLEVLALAVVVGGLVLLALAAKPGNAHPLPRSAQWVLLATLPVVVVCAAAAARRAGRASAVMLAAVAGASFAGAAVAARGLDPSRPWWHVATTPSGWAIAGFGAAGATAFAAALQRGSVTVVAAVVAGVETVPPAIVGFVVLGDTTRSDWGPPLTAVGFVLVLAGVFLLTPYADIGADS